MKLEDCVIMEQVKTLLAKPIYKKVTVGVVAAGVAAYLLYKRYR